MAKIKMIILVTFNSYFNATKVHHYHSMTFSHNLVKNRN